MNATYIATIGWTRNGQQTLIVDTDERASLESMNALANLKAQDGGRLYRRVSRVAVDENIFHAYGMGRDLVAHDDVVDGRPKLVVRINRPDGWE